MGSAPDVRSRGVGRRLAGSSVVRAGFDQTAREEELLGGGKV